MPLPKKRCCSSLQDTSIRAPLVIIFYVKIYKKVLRKFEPNVCRKDEHYQWKHKRSLVVDNCLRLFSFIIGSLVKHTDRKSKQNGSGKTFSLRRNIFSLFFLSCCLGEKDVSQCQRKTREKDIVHPHTQNQPCENSSN